MIREFLRSSRWIRWSDRDDSTSSTDLGAMMPMKVISMLLGIPEDDQEFIRDHDNAQMRTEAGKPMNARTWLVRRGNFEAYIDWRADQSVRRHHDRAAQRRVRRRDRHHPPADPRRDPGLPQRRRRRRQRDDDAADRLGRKGSRRAPRPAPRTRRKPRADPAGDRGAAALRAARAARGPLRDPRRQPPRPDGARRQRDDDADRGGVPRRAPVRPGRERIQHPSRRPGRTSPSASAPTSAWARRWRASKAESPSKRSSNASRSGRSICPTPSSARRRRCGAGRRCRRWWPDDRSGRGQGRLRSAVPPGGRAAATRCGWRKRAPTSSRSTSADRSTTWPTRTRRRTTSPRPPIWSRVTTGAS